MLEIMQDGAMQALNTDDYYIQEEWNGADNLLHLSLPKGHPQMLALRERTQIYDSEDGQVYRISKYDRGKSALDLDAELDLDSLCAGALIGWDNRADADGTQWMPLGDTVAAILQGTGWTVDDQSGRVDVQQMEPFNGTPLEAITQALEVWGGDLGAQYDNAKKIVHLLSPGQRPLTGAYLTEDLNLLEAPQVRGKAPRGEYYNRLYLIGADGLLLPGDHYVEERAASEPIVSHVEANEEIEDVDTLKAVAQGMVKAAAAIQRSYACKVADLYRLRPKEYAHLEIALYDKVILIDRDERTRSYQEIARFRRYPQHPEKNEVTLSAIPSTLSASTKKAASLAKDAASTAYGVKTYAKEQISLLNSSITAMNSRIELLNSEIITRTSRVDINNKTLYINPQGRMGTKGTVGGHYALYKGSSETVDLVHSVTFTPIVNVMTYDLWRLWFCNGLFIGYTDPSWIFSDGGDITEWSGT